MVANDFMYVCLLLHTDGGAMVLSQHFKTKTSEPITMCSHSRVLSVYVGTYVPYVQHASYCSAHTRRQTATTTAVQHSSKPPNSLFVAVYSTYRNATLNNLPNPFFGVFFLFRFNGGTGCSRKGEGRLPGWPAGGTRKRRKYSTERPASASTTTTCRTDAR